MSRENTDDLSYRPQIPESLSPRGLEMAEMFDKLTPENRKKARRIIDDLLAGGERAAGALAEMSAEMGANSH